MSDYRPNSVVSSMSSIFSRNTKTSTSMLSTATSAQSMDDLIAKNDWYKDMLHGLNEDLLNKQKEIDETIVHLKAARSYITQQTDEIANVRSESEAQIKHIVDGQIKHLEAQLSQAHNKSEIQAKQLDSVMNVVNKLKADKEILDEELISEKNTNEDLQNQVENLNEELTFEKTTNEDLQTQIVLEISAYDESQNKRGDLEAEIAELRDRNMVLKNENDAIRAIRDKDTAVLKQSCAEVQQRVTYLEKENGLLKKDRIDWMQDKVDMSEMITKLQLEAGGLVNEKNQLEDGLWVVRGERDNLVADNNVLQARSCQLHNLFANAMHHNAVLQDENMEKTHQIQYLNEQNLELKPQVKEVSECSRRLSMPW
jgi:chromosome segregation ATPase